MLIKLVVTRDGLPTEVQAVNKQKVGYGLEEKAVEAVQKWRFDPGKKSGDPVAVKAFATVEFRPPD